MSDFPLPLPLLGLDHGLKVIGVAISRAGQFAEPLLVIRRKSKAEDFARLNELIAREKIGAVVVGLPPRPPDFVGHSQADTVRNWTAKLAEAITPPIYFWDEGLTSVDAKARLAEVGSRPPQRLDAHAAAVMLQSCLDALREGQPAPERFTPP